MAHSTLPERVSAEIFCGRQQQRECRVGPRDMPRLASALPGDDWQLQVEVRGRQPQPRVLLAEGFVEGQLPLHCSRCANVFDWHLAISFAVRLVDGDADEARWQSEVDTWRADGGELALATCVEDEILLSLPTLPKCTIADCVARFGPAGDVPPQ